MRYKFAQYDVDSVELKCLLISRGLKIDREIYRKLGNTHRIYPNALTCGCITLPDGTIVMATDIGFHLATLSSMFSWDNLKLFRYMNDMKTDFRISFSGGIPVLFYKGSEVCPVGFMPGTDFYSQKTSSGMPFLGNAVLQGCDWVAFQSLWPCDYACSGKPCQFCFTGGQYESLARRKKTMPPVPSPQDTAEVIEYAARNCGANSIQITGGSTFDSADEENYIIDYMKAAAGTAAREKMDGEIELLNQYPGSKTILDLTLRVNVL